MISAEGLVRRALDNVKVEATRRRNLLTEGKGLGIELQDPPSPPTEVLQTALDERVRVAADLIRDFASVIQEWDAEALRAVGEITIPTRGERETALVNLGVLLERGRAWDQSRALSRQAGRAAALAATLHAAYLSRPTRARRSMLRHTRRKAGPPPQR